jgi:hypothetical protein
MMRRASLALCLSTVLFLQGAAVASAEEVEPPTQTALADEITAAEFSDARDESRATTDSPAERKAETVFLDEAAEDSGIHYDATDVEVVAVTDDVQVILPTDATVEGITLTPVPDGGLQVDAEVFGGSGVGEVAGPGAGWGAANFGTYKVTITGWGVANFTYYKNKFTGDGEASRDIWAYRRKAMATPTAIPNAPDARIHKLYIRNYPTTSTYPKLVGWLGRSPGKSFNGDCNTSPLHATVVWTGFELSLDFVDCDKYDVAPNENIPGEYRIEFDQGASISRTGTQEVGYAVQFSVKQGETPYFHDHNSVTYYKSGDSQNCTSYNSDKTCAPS